MPSDLQVLQIEYIWWEGLASERCVQVRIAELGREHWEVHLQKEIKYTEGGFKN